MHLINYYRFSQFSLIQIIRQIQNFIINRTLMISTSFTFIVTFLPSFFSLSLSHPSTCWSKLTFLILTLNFFFFFKIFWNGRAFKKTLLSLIHRVQKTSFHSTYTKSKAESREKNKRLRTNTGWKKKYNIQ